MKLEGGRFCLRRLLGPVFLLRLGIFVGDRIGRFALSSGFFFGLDFGVGFLDFRFLNQVGLDLLG